MSAERFQARVLNDEPSREAIAPAPRLRFRQSPASMRHAAANVVVSVVSGALFLLLWSTIASSERILAIDATAFEIAMSLHSDWLTRIVASITWIGNSSTLTVLSLAVGFWLARVGSRRRLVAFGAAMALGALLNVALKTSVQRVRPGVFEHLVSASGYSFPSGHSMGSMLFFGSLGYVLAVTLDAHRAWRALAVVSCLGCAVAIGLSRVYLGVHYFSDVMGGFAAGICWIGICIAATEAWTARRDKRVKSRGRDEGGQ